MPVPEHQQTVDRHLLRDSAYDKLCGAIVDGTLAPGEPLHDGEICSWLGLSRTPIRQALARLREERLIEMAPQKFTRVAPLRRHDVQEVIPLLAVLHGLATELAVPRLRPADVERLNRDNGAYVAALRAADGPAAFASDEQFHGVFLEASGNTELPRVLAHLTPRLMRIERLSGAPLPGRRAVAQHQAIISRAETGDAPGAAAAVRANWIGLGNALEEAFTNPS